MRFILTLILLISLFNIGNCQDVPLSPSHNSVYSFLDELANAKIIEINSGIKPYSRKFIYEKLVEANEKSKLLNNRQKNEIEFYIRQYTFEKMDSINSFSQTSKINIFKKSKYFSTNHSPLGFFYKDINVGIALKPVWGIRYMVNENGTHRYTWGGADLYLNINSHWGIYTSLREHNMNEALSLPDYFVQYEGGNYKIESEGISSSTYSEAKGGITYTWKWGEIGLVKDQVQWGVNYNGSNIFSGRTPSFPMIKFSISPVEWFDFNYYHGWLVSNVVDSSSIYYTANGDLRRSYRPKYIAANMYTFKLWKQLHFSLGNSIIYSDMNVNPAYLIPFLFYKSVDHTINYGIDNQNSQMYGMLSCRLIKNFHFYGNLFIDDFSYKRITDDKRQNFIGSKVGGKLSNWPIRNVSLVFEYTKTNPIVYKHRVETTTFESNLFNLGHYLRDNSQEFYASAEVKLLRGLIIKSSFLKAIHGNEYEYTDGNEAERLPFTEDKTWEMIQGSVKAQYEIMSEMYIYLDYTYSDISTYEVDGQSAEYYMELYTPEFYYGITNTFSVGLYIGF